MKSVFIGLIVIIVYLTVAPTEAQTLTVLHNFNKADGCAAVGDLTLNGSTLYGMTSQGGTNNWGTIFSIPVSGGTLTTLFNFEGTHGSYPLGSLTINGSTLYGMAEEGGTNNDGTIFSIPVNGGTPTTLFKFDGSHGYYPNGSLTLSSDSSSFYGMTFAGGTNGVGTVFSISVSGGTPTTLSNFGRPLGKTLGSAPCGSLTLSPNGSTLYGMTKGGGINGWGTVFSIPVSGGIPTTLFDFDGTHGSSPEGDLTLSSDGSTLYGMTLGGGTTGDGTIFSIPVSGGPLTTLFNFDKIHGQYPTGSLTLSGSTIYGMTEYGGNNNYGTIFSIPVSGGIPTTLFNFDGTHGGYPAGSLTLGGSTLYGMAGAGGTSGYGTIFALSIPEPSTLALLSLASISFLLFHRRAGGVIKGLSSKIIRTSSAVSLFRHEPKLENLLIGKVNIRPWLFSGHRPSERKIRFSNDANAASALRDRRTP